MEIKVERDITVNLSISTLDVMAFIKECDAPLDAAWILSAILTRFSPEMMQSLATFYADHPPTGNAYQRFHQQIKDATDKLLAVAWRPSEDNIRDQRSMQQFKEIMLAVTPDNLADGVKVKDEALGGGIKAMTIDGPTLAVAAVTRYFMEKDAKCETRHLHYVGFNEVGTRAMLTSGPLA